MGGMIDKMWLINLLVLYTDLNPTYAVEVQAIPGCNVILTWTLHYR
jgi:hypothetical protein